MSDLYYCLANMYCRERCPFRVDDGIKPECINCQVPVFGEWLDDYINMDYERKGALDEKHRQNE